MNNELAFLNEALQENGYRLTPARRTILQFLVQSDGHITADALAEMVRRDSPNIGRMTVYRTLELLSMLGVIRPIDQGTGAAHYVLLKDGHHHHLVCINCNRVLEVEDCGLGDVQEQIGQRFKFQVTGHLVEFFGLCEGCQ